MQTARNIHILAAPDWRSRDVLTLTEVAAIAARSYTWARNRLTDGGLEPRGFDVSGVAIVSVKSVLSLLTDVKQHGRRPRPRLRLVVSR